MGCNSSKENKPKDNKPQEAKKVAEKPQEPKKVAEKPQEPKKVAEKPQEPKKVEAQPLVEAPVEPVAERSENANEQENPQEPVRESVHSSVKASVKESEKAPEEVSVQASTASVRAVTPTPSERATSPPPPPETSAQRANVPQLQMGEPQAANRAVAQTPRGERSISPRRYPVEVAIRRESAGSSPAARKVDATSYTGPAPATDFPIESVYRCFDEGNGLLFRLVNDKRHIWAFYNDTEVYTMHVCVTFGHESMVRPLGKTTQEVHDEETGHCTLEVDVAPGETQPFMRGEFNGFVTYYDADPIPYESRKH